MSDSRGLERLYEQGALLYAHLGSFANANLARNLEAELIGKGLRNSVTKKQKEDVLRSVVDVEAERRAFLVILRDMGIDSEIPIVPNVDHFFFGSYPRDQITPLPGDIVSGRVRGAVGRYLILENSGRLYGYWLNGLLGYRVRLGSELRAIDSEPLQSALF
jgi:hypothetical protein